ncbi:3-methyladenine DNA glycosylase AlkD [Granulicatella balaenopterae]|uniref:3-methyladenine DNA glycosylase AlkD n=1 Tax=Granulicatella balaenopterae TaxID=137733 RepID=A0A1H9KD94_9LACT|nr:DNA alkylation repair protein [Granulicatella balaenopterae]SEQ96843.1 3-methyladenine DNA glycosylase AlkD [Granulicatella balaenopterae]
MEIIQEMLLKEQDLGYLAFNQKLVPNQQLIGVRIPIIRSLAKRLVREEPDVVNQFLQELPHQYLEENHLHVFLLQEEKDLERLLERTDNFLPYLDNWQTCDSFLPPLFKNNQSQLPLKIKEWLQSTEEFTKRYAMRLKLARQEFLQKDICDVITVGQTDEYYVYMMAAWYLSIAARKNPSAFQSQFTLNKMGNRLYQATLRKICESKQFTHEEKLSYKRMADDERRSIS